jgi:hypothetical protein
MFMAAAVKLVLLVSAIDLRMQSAGARKDTSLGGHS